MLHGWCRRRSNFALGESNGASIIDDKMLIMLILYLTISVETLASAPGIFFEISLSKNSFNPLLHIDRGRDVFSVIRREFTQGL